jgi:agmatinase
MAKSDELPLYSDAKSPGYAGVKTFFGADQAEPDDLSEDVDVAGFGVPFDGGVSNKPGTRYGPEALRDATDRHSRTFQSEDERFTIGTERTACYDSVTFRDCGDAPVVPNDITRTFDLVRAYTEVISRKTMPVLLGGDHYITYPAFVGYADSVGENVGLLHLDAHTDTWGENDLYGEHYHGSPMARIAESEYGSYANHAMVGIRGHADMEFLDILEEDGLYVDYGHEVQDKGIEESIRGAIDHVTEDVDHVYLTIDIDVTDPSYAPGTGTPSPGGLTSHQLLTAADLLGECDAIGAMDLMEVAPNLDPTDTTSMLGANTLARFLESYFYDDVA